MPCPRCQATLRPKEDSGFHWHRLLRAIPRTYCSPCRAERLLTGGSHPLLFWLGAAAMGALAMGLEATRVLGSLIGNLLLLQLLTVAILTPLHELGHAAAGWLAGLEVRRIVLGRGRRVWSGRLGRLQLDLRAEAGVGATMLAATNTRFFRTRMFVGVLGGPLVNVAGAFALPNPLSGFALLESPHPLGALMPLAVLSIANWIILLGNLVPWSSKGPTGPAWSDGAFLARLLVMSDRAVRLMQAGTELREWGELREAGDYERAGTLATAMRHRHPDLPELQSFVGVSALDRGSPLEARACFRAALEGADTPAARAISQSNVAYADFVLAMDDLRAEADRLSAEAMCVVGEIGAIRGTRGSVLVWLGRADEGIPLLERAFEEYDDVRARAGYACTLAMGFTALGDVRAAERWLDIAARLDPDCPIFTRAQASVSGVRPRLSSTGC